MSVTGDNIRAFNNLMNRNYAVDFFHNSNGNRLIAMIIDWIESGGVGGNGAALSLTPVHVTSANFVNATDCPIPAFIGQNLFIIWAEGPKIMVQGADFSLLAGGGFSVLIPGFDATTATFNFFVFTTP